MIQLNLSTIWEDFSQYIYKYNVIVLKSAPLNMFSSVHVHCVRHVIEVEANKYAGRQTRHLCSCEVSWRGPTKLVSCQI